LIPAFEGSNPSSPAIKTKKKSISRQRKTTSQVLAAFNLLTDCI